MNLPSRLLALSLEVSGDKMMKQNTREYNLIVNYMHGIRHSKAAVGLGSLTKVKRALDNKLFKEHVAERVARRAQEVEARTTMKSAASPAQQRTMAARRGVPQAFSIV